MEGATAMSPYELITRSIRFGDELFNRRNLAVIDELIADDFISHDPLPGMPNDKAGVFETARVFRAAYPDWRFQNDAIIAQGDLVAHRVTWRGTHRGAFLGIAASGNAVEVRSMDFLRFRDGQIVERWSLFDAPSFFEQLGASPTGGAPA
jgi:steroid delta-isomerase-like uncharacterized protein